jgi:hypothetical protein
LEGLIIYEFLEARKLKGLNNIINSAKVSEGDLP